MREIPSFWRNNPSVVIKQPVVRAILRDIFRIPSHGIYFSSHAILNTSDRILFPSEKIGEISEKTGEISEKIERRSEKFKKRSENVVKSLRIRARFVGRMILNSRKKHKLLPSLLEILPKIRPNF